MLVVQAVSQKLEFLRKPEKNQRPSPWGKISEGETVWMKLSGGPVVAKAKVSGYRQIMNCTASQLRSAVAGLALHDLE